MKTARSVLRDVLSMKAKSLMTLFTVAVGVSVLVLALSISEGFSRNVTEKLSQEGLIVTVANAGFSDEGGLEPVRPGEFDENVIATIEANMPGVAAAAPVTQGRWRDIVVGDQAYTVRQVIGSTGAYLDIMGLSLVAGVGFNDADIESGATKALVTESIARSLSGSAESAVGQTFRPPAVGLPGPGGGGGGMRQRQQVARTFTIIGVYEDPPEVRRKAYGIADLVVPYTSLVPNTQNLSMAMRFLLGTIAVKVEGMGFESAQSQLRSALAMEYGADVTLHVWEGRPDGTSGSLEETRRTVSTFSLIVNLLGFVLLVTGSIGILSIMIVEVLGRSREIALERALGATRQNIVVEYFLRSVLMSSLSALLGVGISLVFARPLSALLLPIFQGIGVTPDGSAMITTSAVVVGVSTALLVGGVLGTMPIFSSLKPPISDSIREG